MRQTITGEGDLYEGDRLLRRVFYTITVTRSFKTARTFGGETQVEGQASVGGWLRPMEGPPDFWSEWDRGDAYTVILADGRRWECAFIGPDGEMATAGGDELLAEPTPAAQADVR